MLRQELKRDFKDMTRCKEFYFSLLISFALVFGVLFFCLFSFYKTDVTYLNPAYVYWGRVELDLIGMRGILQIHFQIQL